MTINEFALFGYQRSTQILQGMTADLTPAEWVQRPVAGANCAAWIVGHLLTIERTAVVRLTDAAPALPDADFANRHGIGSQPAPDADYGDVLALMPLWNAQRQLLVDLITALPPAEFGRPLEHPRFKTLGQILSLMPVHTTLHCGQLSTIRRSLGKPALF